MKKELTEKEKRINKEKKRLLEVYGSLDKNTLTVAKSLIERAAFITVSLEDLEAAVNDKGFVEDYTNGEHQKGKKRGVEIDLYLSLTKDLRGITVQLSALVPPSPDPNSRLNQLKNL